jgi:hypothetical protein
MNYRLAITENKSWLKMIELRSVKRAFNQEISHVTATMDLYSDSAEDLETVCYFLDFHDIKESPKKTQKPVTDLLESGQLAQSESQKDFNCKDEFAGKKIPCPGEDLIYFNTL